jgi:hypothetical protein
VGTGFTGDVLVVGAFRPRGQIADLHVLERALPKGGHGRLLCSLAWPIQARAGSVIEDRGSIDEKPTGGITTGASLYQLPRSGLVQYGSSSEAGPGCDDGHERQRPLAERSQVADEPRVGLRAELPPEHDFVGRHEVHVVTLGVGSRLDLRMKDVTEEAGAEPDDGQGPQSSQIETAILHRFRTSGCRDDGVRWVRHWPVMAQFDCAGSVITECRCAPIPAISQTAVSPARIQRGSARSMLVPAGLPAAMMSPGRSVRMFDA